MRKLIRITTVMLILVSLLVSASAVAFASFFENQTVWSNWYGIKGSIPAIGDKFEVTNGLIVKSVTFYMKRKGTLGGGSAPPELRIYNADNETLLYSQDLPSWNSLSTGGASYKITLTTPFLMVTGNYYVVYYNTWGTTSSYPNIAYSITPQISGHSLYQYSTASGWTQLGTGDLYFQYEFEIGDIPVFSGLYVPIHTNDGVTLTAQVNSNGGTIDQVGFDMGTTSGNYTQEFLSASATDGQEIFYEFLDMNDIERNTRYYWRAKAHNGFGWGYTAEQDFIYQPITVTTGTAQLSRQSDNWTATMLVNVTPNTADNVSLHLGTTVGVWENDSDISQIPLNMGNYHFNTFDNSGGIIEYPLSNNTTYFYQGYATINGTDFYGIIRSFNTSNAWEAERPTLEITRIRDITSSYAGATAPVIEITARVLTLADEVLQFGFENSLSSNGLTLIPQVYRATVNDALTESGEFHAIYFFQNVAWWQSGGVYWQAWARNAVGEGQSEIVMYEPVFVNPNGQQTTGGSTGVVPTIGETLDSVKSGLGLVGEMGSWVFMGVLLLIVALLFGMSIAGTDDSKVKAMIAVAWGLTSIAIAGAFIFTGQLGIWPILILTGGVVMLILVITSVKLSGSSGG